MSDYVCGYTLQYQDRVEVQELHRGTREDCERVADLCPGIAIASSARCQASMHVVPAELWDDFWRASSPDSSAEERGHPTPTVEGSTPSPGIAGLAVTTSSAVGLLPDTQEGRREARVSGPGAETTR